MRGNWVEDIFLFQLYVVLLLDDLTLTLRNSMYTRVATLSEIDFSLFLTISFDFIIALLSIDYYGKQGNETFLYVQTLDSHHYIYT